MYRLDWIEQLKVRQLAWPRTSRVMQVSPVVWGLGITSLLTDISAEMVSSILPVYLVLHLHLSPLQYGVIDGIYNGLSIALVGLTAGFMADRWSRQKEIAAGGYGVSAICKLLLLAAGASWGWIVAIVGLDRLGKGIRTAPRDALISLHTPAFLYGTAFGVHRALDSMGALLGPIIAFGLLVQLPGGFDVLWIVSFIVAFLGFAALWLFVPSAASARQDSGAPMKVSESTSRSAGPWISRRLLGLAACATLLAMATVSDGFLYLLLQQKGEGGFAVIPLFYVITAGSYMLFAIPVGILADRHGRRRTFVGGYVVLVLLYAALILSDSLTLPAQAACLVFLGLYYAATEGVVMALASRLVPRVRRATGLAIVATCIGVGKLISSLVFGWSWQQYGTTFSIVAFGAAAFVAISVTTAWLGTWREE